MNSYEWNCKTVDVYPENGDNKNVVYNVHFEVKGVSEEVDSDGLEYSSTSIGTQELSIDDVKEFVEFEDLTNEDLVAWTKSAMGEDLVNSIEDSLRINIEKMITPDSVTITID